MSVSTSQPPVSRIGYVNIKFQGPGSNCREITFQHFQPMHLAKYAEMIGENVENLKFLFNGTKLYTTDTPARLKMKENNVIEVEEIEGINIKFMGANNFSRELNLVVRTTLPMIKAMKEYADIVGEDISYLRFMHNVGRVCKEDIPRYLKDNDTIQVYPEFEHVNIKIVFKDGFELDFRVEFNTPLGQLKNDFATQVGINIYSMWFLYDGRRINDVDTPNLLEMEEYNVVDAQQSQMGGYH